MPDSKLRKPRFRRGNTFASSCSGSCLSVTLAGHSDSSSSPLPCCPYICSIQPFTGLCLGCRSFSLRCAMVPSAWRCSISCARTSALGGSAVELQPVNTAMVPTGASRHGNAATFSISQWPSTSSCSPPHQSLSSSLESHGSRLSNSNCVDGDGHGGESRPETQLPPGGSRGDQRSQTTVCQVPIHSSSENRVLATTHSNGHRGGRNNTLPNNFLYHNPPSSVPYGNPEEAVGQPSTSISAPYHPDGDEKPLPLIVLDLRPLEAFSRQHIAGSINLALPSLVVRRMRKATAAAIATATSPLQYNTGNAVSLSTHPVANLGTYTTTSSCKRRLDQALDWLNREGESSSQGRNRSPLDLWRADVVIVCQGQTELSSKFCYDNIGSTQSPQNSSVSSMPSFTSAANASSSSNSLDVARAVCQALQHLPSSPGSPRKRGRVMLCPDDAGSIFAHPAAGHFVEEDGGSEVASTISCRSTQAGPEISTDASRFAQRDTRSATQRSDGGVSAPPTLEIASQHNAPSSSLETSSYPGSIASNTLNGPQPVAQSNDSSTQSSFPLVKPPSPARASKRPARPMLSRLDTSERVKTLNAQDNVAPSNTAQAKQANHVASTPAAPYSPGNSVPRSAASTPASTCASVPARISLPSLQTVAHLQARLPPSPASFRDATVPVSPSTRLPAAPDAAHWHTTPQAMNAHQIDREVARRGSVPFEDVDPLVGRGSALPSNHTRRALECLEAPIFDVSTVVPSFLFLGPDITSQDEAEQLKALGIKRILNCAVEVSDKSGESHATNDSSDNTLRLKGIFDKYLKIPMWDNVEAQGVAEHFEQACAFIDDAKLHDAPVYVHCRAGKSRSVSVVMAWLIHAYRWTLKKSYDYVVERRQDISPNIGFVSCLMAFEEQVHSRKSHILAETGSRDGEMSGDDSARALRHSRQSMPVIHPIKSSPHWPDTIADEDDARSVARAGQATGSDSMLRPSEVEGINRRATVLGMSSMIGSSKDATGSST